MAFLEIINSVNAALTINYSTVVKKRTTLNALIFKSKT